MRNNELVFAVAKQFLFFQFEALYSPASRIFSISGEEGHELDIFVLTITFEVITCCITKARNVIKSVSREKNSTGFNGRGR